MGLFFGNRKGTCDDCGETAPLTKTGNGRRVCGDCLEDYIRCSVCGKYFPEDGIMFSFDSGMEFCDACFEVMAEDLID